ncbi:hypothetical protein C8Q80DRAFT_1267464 [Daedaleopsis nitida]|nr:hypothetical protein C8Q80DRAFT_1267464 [Daedaleopsis nitida]
MISLEAIYTKLPQDIRHWTSLTTAIKFLRLTTELKPAIVHAQPLSYDPAHVPEELDSQTTLFILKCLGLDGYNIEHLWAAFGVAIWLEGRPMLGAYSNSSTRVHGLLDIGATRSE